MKSVNQLIFVLIVWVISACNNAGEKTALTASAADAIYFGGDIVTMEGDSANYAEAVAVKDGKIIFVGSKEDADKIKGDSTAMNDLAGKTMLPGFIDGHGHFSTAMVLPTQANCFSSPAGSANDVDGIIASLNELKTRRKIAKGDLVIGYGYDENQMPGGNLLNRDNLDKAFPDNPVIVWHVSQHGGVLNSLAMTKYGFSAKSVTPPGGVIVRKPGTKEPYGLIMETAFLPVFMNLPKPTTDALLKGLKEVQQLYTSVGVTTAQDGSTHHDEMDLLTEAAKQHLLDIDIVSYALILDLREILKSHPFSDFGAYNNHLKLAGVKIVSDGSPQGKTAFFTKPYLTGGPTGQKNWVGEPSFPQDSLNAWVKWVYDGKVQLAVHCNGDAAIDMLLKAHRSATSADSAIDRRTFIIHSQFVRMDQLKKYKDYNMIPSMFTEHAFYFGDTHIANRGLEQASFLSPLHTAIEMGLKPANHTDFPVLPINQMMVVSTAVNRTTRTGVVLGANERVTPYQALQCITINGAHLYFEENSKGSLKAGKLADLVILDQNPIKVDPGKIKDIVVVETIKEGKSVFKK